MLLSVAVTHELLTNIRTDRLRWQVQALSFRSACHVWPCDSCDRFLRPLLRLLLQMCHRCAKDTVDVAGCDACTGHYMPGPKRRTDWSCDVLLLYCWLLSCCCFMSSISFDASSCFLLVLRCKMRPSICRGCPKCVLAVLSWGKRERRRAGKCGLIEWWLCRRMYSSCALLYFLSKEVQIVMTMQWHHARTWLASPWTKYRPSWGNEFLAPDGSGEEDSSLPRWT
jgi:hypothetical protein